VTGAQDALKENGQNVTKREPLMKRLPASGAGRSLARWWKKYGRGECGSELTEFAICVNVFFGFCFAFMELCMILLLMHSVNDASRQAARWASVRGTSSSVSGSCVNPNISSCPAAQSDVQTFAQALPGMSSGKTQVTVNWCNSDGTTGCTTSESYAIPGHIVKVTVTYRFLGINLSSTAEKVVWQ
jgi:Flp pilus assembly protein TadG